jgi:hypothetical protein
MRCRKVAPSILRFFFKGLTPWIGGIEVPEVFLGLPFGTEIQIVCATSKARLTFVSTRRRVRGVACRAQKKDSRARVVCGCKSETSVGKKQLRENMYYYLYG